MANIGAGSQASGGDDGSISQGPFGTRNWPISGKRAYRYVGDNITDRYARQYLRSSVSCSPGSPSGCVLVENTASTPTTTFDWIGEKMAVHEQYGPDDIVRNLLDIDYSALALNTAGAIVTPSGIASGALDVIGGTPDVVIAGIDTAANPNYWRYVVGRTCMFGDCGGWSAPISVGSGAAVLSGGAVVLADFNGDLRKDVLLTGVDNCGGGGVDTCDDYFRYRILSNCNNLGSCATWSDIKTTPAVSNGTDLLSGANGGGAAAVGDLDLNGVPDILIVAMDLNARGTNMWLFAIGMNCGPDGNCAGGWTTGRLPVGATGMHGAGVAIADLDGDGVATEIVFSGTHTQVAPSTDGLRHQGWRYVVGRCPGGFAPQCTFRPVQTVEAEDNTLEANWAWLTEGNIVSTPPPLGKGLSTVAGAQIILSGKVTNQVPGAQRRAHILTRAGRACNMNTGICEFGPSRAFQTGIRDLLGGQVGILQTNPNVAPSVIFAAIDHRSGLNDNFVYGYETPRLDTFEQFYFGPYDVEEGNIRRDNDSMATATRIGLASGDRVYEIDRAQDRCPDELPGCTDDLDFYTFDLPTSSTVEITMQHKTGSGVPSSGDLDLQLLGSSGSLIASSALGVTGGWVTETITQPLSAGKYFVKVFGYKYLFQGRATGFYVMRVRQL